MRMLLYYGFLDCLIYCIYAHVCVRTHVHVLVYGMHIPHAALCAWASEDNAYELVLLSHMDLGWNPGFQA